MITGNETSLEDNETKQAARAKLRESFLRTIHELRGQTCSILTYEKTQLKATFEGWNLEGHEMLVKDMATPTGQIMTAALLRNPDVIAVQFDKPLVLP